MKLKSFRVTNFRSIIDSKECFLSPNDGITILAGQNESGKSSLLEALHYYGEGSHCISAYRDEEDIQVYPNIVCTYTIDPKDNILNKLLSTATLKNDFKEMIKTPVFTEYLKKPY